MLTDRCMERVLSIQKLARDLPLHLLLNQVWLKGWDFERCLCLYYVENFLGYVRYQDACYADKDYRRKLRRNTHPLVACRQRKLATNTNHIQWYQLRPNTLRNFRFTDVRVFVVCLMLAAQLWPCSSCRPCQCGSCNS